MKIFKISQNPTRNRLVWVIIGVIAVVTGYALYVKFFIYDDDGLENFFLDLEKLGYIANRGFAGMYYPGNVIQIVEEGPEGNEQRLEPPIVLLWHTDCFPDQTPKEKNFSSLRLLNSKAKASLQLRSDILSELFPMFRVDSNAVADYTLVLQNQRLIAYARADLNKRFSEKCKNELYEAIYEEGDKEHWFKVILEAVVADSLNLELHWKTTTSAESRSEVAANAAKGLTEIARDITYHAEASGVMVGLVSENEKKTVISAKGLIILGYRKRPIEVKLLEKEGLRP